MYPQALKMFFQRFSKPNPQPSSSKLAPLKTRLLELKAGECVRFIFAEEMVSQLLAANSPRFDKGSLERGTFLAVVKSVGTTRIGIVVVEVVCVSGGRVKETVVMETDLCGMEVIGKP
jgi:hypothetical protein